MWIIKISPEENGARQIHTYCGVLPGGWAVIPDAMPLPQTAPFVEIETETVDGGRTVTSLTEGVIPEQEEEHE